MDRHSSRLYDIPALKAAAAARWLDIFRTLAGVEIDPNPSHHGPCPKCKGTDRFRCIDIDQGVLYCNQCFAEKNGDGIAALAWLTGNSFKDTLKSLADYLNIKATKSAAAPPTTTKVHATIRGLVMALLPSMVKKYGRGVKLVAKWEYPTFAVLRFNLPTPAGEKQRKEFRPICQVPIGQDGWIGWRAGYPDGPRPLYRLPDVQATDQAIITIHGGEKATDAARGLGLNATTNAGGEQAIKKTDWTPLARFALAAIVIDNDEAGEKFGRMVASVLKAQNPAQIIKIIRLPNLPPKGDIVEWIAAGGTKEQFGQVVEAMPVITGIAAPVTDVNEDDDDPHRLARVNLENYALDRGRVIVFWRDEFYVWKNNCYKHISEKELRAKIGMSIKNEYNRINRAAIQEHEDHLAATSKDEDPNYKPPKAKKVSCQIIGATVQATASMTVMSAEIEPNTWIPNQEQRPLVSLTNGILDMAALMTGQDECLTPNSPDWFSLASLPYGFDPSATCPKWEAFLERNLEMDPERIKIVQEWAGYCLLPSTEEQNFLINEGEGANGKGVFTAGLTAMLGEKNVSSVPLELFNDKFARTDTLGKLLNAAGDCGEIDKASEGFIKSFTHGDRMFFDRKNSSGVTCRPTARLMISCNNRPRFSDRTDGIWRKMLLIPWRVQIAEKEQVRGMDKVEWWTKTGELAGMLNWAIRGLHRLLQQKGFTSSIVMKDAVNDYKTDVNPARQFLQEYCRPGGKDSRILGKDLYDSYHSWCKKNGYSFPLASMQFGKEVKRTFPWSERKRETTGVLREYYYYGLTLDYAEQGF